MRICLFTQTNAAFEPVSSITVPVMSEYARRHNYRLHVFLGEPQRSIIWDRYRIMAENMDGFDWLIHIDADVLLTNHHIRIEELVPRHEHMAMALCSCEDGKLRLNDGVSIFSADSYMKWYMMRCFEHAEGDGIWCGQDVIQRDLDNGKLDGILKIERQKALNSLLYQEYGMPETTIGQWTPGDFALHLPGRTNQRRVELLNQYEKHILR